MVGETRWRPCCWHRVATRKVSRVNRTVVPEEKREKPQDGSTTGKKGMEADQEGEAGCDMGNVVRGLLSTSNLFEPEIYQILVFILPTLLSCYWFVGCELKKPEHNILAS